MLLVLTKEKIQQKESKLLPEVKGLSLTTITKELNCIPPSCQSARKEQLLEELKTRKITDQNILEWFKAFSLGGIKNKSFELRSFQIAILRKLIKLELTDTFRRKIPLFDDYVKELKLK